MAVGTQLFEVSIHQLWSDLQNGTLLSKHLWPDLLKTTVKTYQKTVLYIYSCYIHITILYVYKTFIDMF